MTVGSALVTTVLATWVLTSTACADDTSTLSTSTPIPTQTPQPTGFSAGPDLTAGDLAIRGRGSPGQGPFDGERLLIPRIVVDAPIAVARVGPDRRLPNPSGPFEVAWYDFSGNLKYGGYPGSGGNAVFAGYVDYIRVGPAVFWLADELATGDLIHIRRSDQSLLTYAVEFNKTIPQDSELVEQVVYATAYESITLITETGLFEPGNGYADYRIIWAVRIECPVRGTPPASVELCS